MRLVRAALEFGMILHADIERQPGQLDRFDKIAVRRGAADAEAGFRQHIAECVVEFIAVTVPLGNMRLTVAAHHRGILRNDAGIAAEPERAALVDALRLSLHEIYDLMHTLRRKFSRMRIGHSCHVPCKFDHGNLHSEADAEIGLPVLPRILRCCDHALNPAPAKAARNQDPVNISEHFCRVFRCDLFRVDPVDLHIRTELIARVMQSLGNGHICIMKLHIFADQPDRDLSAR